MLLATNGKSTCWSRGQAKSIPQVPRKSGRRKPGISKRQRSMVVGSPWHKTKAKHKGKRKDAAIEMPDRTWLCMKRIRTPFPIKASDAGRQVAILNLQSVFGPASVCASRNIAWSLVSAGSKPMYSYVTHALRPTRFSLANCLLPRQLSQSSVPQRAYRSVSSRPRADRDKT